METKEDRWWRSGDFKEETFESDLEKIVNYYQDQGYMDARISDYDIAYSKDGKYLTLVVSLFEGNQFRLGQVSWEGNQLFSEAKLAAQFELKEGDIFAINSYQKTKFLIESLYREEGYLYVSVNVIWTIFASIKTCRVFRSKAMIMVMIFSI